VRLALYEFETGVETIGGNRVVYDVANDTAHFGAASIDGHALVWQLDHDETEAEGALLSARVDLDPFSDWVIRCDTVAFPLAGVAYRHTHPGPGIRYLLHGGIEIKTGGTAHNYGPGGAWFENGADPVEAFASAHTETSFVRAMVLPAEWAGKRTITYVDPADDDLPKLQRAAIHCEHALELPR